MSSFSSSPASSVSASAPAPHVVEDCLGVVQLLSDGTVTRPTRSILSDPPAHEVRRDLPVEWKDVVYDESHGLRLRMYRPATVTTDGGDGEKKNLPVVVYFHGGGFCLGSFEHPSFHEVGLRIAHDLPAVVLSADYRLAPEHRLPAGQNDGETVLSWLSGHAVSGADPWLAESADLERVFVWGDSSGGNIAHHVAVRHGSGLDIDPVRVAGYVLLCPYFGGEERMASEASSPRDVLMSLALFDQMWRLALPVGATRDHPAANPFGPESAPFDGVVFPPVLVVDAEQDLLRDRTADYVARLRTMGKPVELVVFLGQAHGFFVYEPWGAAADELVRVVRQFVHGGAPATS